MKSFFAFWDQVDPKDAFPQFGALHIAALAMMALVLYLSLKGIKRMKPSKAKAVIRVAAVAVPVVEFTHTYWLYLCGEKDLIRLLPLHLCAMQSFFIPLAVFSGKTIFWEFIYATSILGGIFATVFPVGVADVYPLLHYQTIQTFVLHSLLIFVPMALILSLIHI